MKNQVGRPDLGSRGKYLCLSVLCFMLSLFFFFCFKDLFIDNLCTGLKLTFTQIGPIFLALHLLGLGFWMFQVLNCF